CLGRGEGEGEGCKMQDAGSQIEQRGIVNPESCTPPMKSAVTISLVPEAKGGPFVFWEGLENGCAKPARLGFDAVEVFAPGAAAIDRKNLTHLLEKHHLALAALGTGAGWLIHKWHLCHPSAEVRRQAREFVRQLIEFAGQFGAPA